MKKTKTSDLALFSAPYFRTWIKLYWPKAGVPTPQKTAFGWLDKLGLTKYTGLVESREYLKLSDCGYGLKHLFIFKKSLSI